MPMSKVEVLRAACCIAGIDQDICDREQVLLNKLAEAAGVGRASLNAMMDRARTDPNFFQEQFRIMKAEPDEAFKLVLSVAIANGRLTTDERVILHHFAEKLNIAEDRFEKLLATAEKRTSA
jgi:tellurite resistance protein